MALLPVEIEANSAVIQTSGSSVRLISSDEVRMVSEVVRGRVVREELKDGKPGWTRWSMLFECEFVLENLTDEEVQIEVGFPTSRRTPLNGIPTEKHVESELAEMQMVVTRDGGAPLDLRAMRSDVSGELGPFGVWKMSFAPHERTTLRVAYRTFPSMGLGSALAGEWPEGVDRVYGYFGQALFFGFTYVTKTAATWAGDVESATFEFDSRALQEAVDKHMFPGELEGAPAEGPPSNPLQCLSVTSAGDGPNGRITWTESTPGIYRLQTSDPTALDYIGIMWLGFTFLAADVPHLHTAVDGILGTGKELTAKRAAFQADLLTMLRDLYREINGTNSGNDDALALYGAFSVLHALPCELHVPEDVIAALEGMIEEQRHFTEDAEATDRTVVRE